MDNASLADDLFGSDDEVAENKVRELSDRELDSGDDEDRSDRARANSDSAGLEDRPEEPEPSVVLDTKVFRHPLPKPSDGEVRSKILSVRDETYQKVVQRFAIAKVSWYRPAPIRPPNLRTSHIRSPYQYEVCRLFCKCRCRNHHALPQKPLHWQAGE